MFLIRKIYKSGFTLIELMLASALLLSALGAFLVTFNTILKNANYSQGLSLAFSECRTQLEQMVAHNFGTLLTDYSVGGDPGPNFNLTTSPIIGITGRGNITITERSDLVPGGWQQAVAQGVTWSPRVNFAAVVYNGRMYVLGGDTTPPVNDGGEVNDVWWTDDLDFSDGQTWHCATPNAPWLPRRGHAAFVYDNKIWVMGGRRGAATVTNDIWYSVDGEAWLPANNNVPGLASDELQSLVYNGTMWAFREANLWGPAGNVWHSQDGSNWSEAVANPSWPWPPLSSYSTAVYHNEMWVMGGGPAVGGVLSQVRWTGDVNLVDGQTWQSVAGNANWPARRGHSSLVYDNNLWVMGGYGADSQERNDVWWTDDLNLVDGQTWNSAGNAEWPARGGHSSLVYKNRMWVMGGFGNSGLMNDVWYCMGSGGRLFEVVITVSWRHPDGRIFGEDTNRDGIWDPATEDANGNGRYDSPAQLRVLLSDKNIAATRRMFLGRP